MNHRAFKSFATTALVLAAAITALSLAPSAHAASRAALVEPAQPSRPFFDSVVGSGYRSLGPGAGGTLGMTSITLTNSGTAAQSVFVFAPVFGSGQVCGSTNVIGGSSPRFYVNVPAGQTVHLTYPTPVVYTPVNGQSCIAFSGGNGLDISVNGFID